MTTPAHMTAQEIVEALCEAQADVDYEMCGGFAATPGTVAHRDAIKAALVAVLQAAMVARVVKRWKDCVWTPRSQGALMRDDVLRLVERECKRAVAEEREACAQTALDCECVFTPGHHCKTIAKAIRARGRK